TPPFRGRRGPRRPNADCQDDRFEEKRHCPKVLVSLLVGARSSSAALPGARYAPCGPIRIPARDWHGCPHAAADYALRVDPVVPQTLSEEPISQELRGEAREHIRDHARKEAARIERLSRVREFVLGAQDGLLVPLGVVTGMAAANPGKAAILVAGLAE